MSYITTCDVICQIAHQVTKCTCRWIICNIIGYLCILDFLIIHWERVDDRITIVLHRVCLAILGNFSAIHKVPHVTFLHVFHHWLKVPHVLQVICLFLLRLNSLSEMLPLVKQKTELMMPYHFLHLPSNLQAQSSPFVLKLANSLPAHKFHFLC